MKRMMHFIHMYKCMAVGILGIVTILGTVTLISAQPSAYCSGICDLAWSPVEGNLLGAVNELGLWLYRFNGSESEPLFFPHENATTLSFDPDGKYVAITSCPGMTTPTDECKGTELYPFEWSKKLS